MMLEQGKNLIDKRKIKGPSWSRSVSITYTQNALVTFKVCISIWFRSLQMQGIHNECVSSSGPFNETNICFFEDKTINQMSYSYWKMATCELALNKTPIRHERNLIHR